MNNKGALLFILGLLTLTLATVEHVSAKGGAMAEPVTYEFVNLGPLPSTKTSLEDVKRRYAEMGKKGMKPVGTESYYAGGTVYSAVEVFGSR